MLVILSLKLIRLIVVEVEDEGECSLEVLCENERERESGKVKMIVEEG